MLRSRGSVLTGVHTVPMTIREEVEASLGHRRGLGLGVQLKVLLNKEETRSSDQTVRVGETD